MTERAGDAPLRNPGFTVQQTQGGGQSRITHGQEEYRPQCASFDSMWGLEDR